jgi:hypothetical protein
MFVSRFVAAGFVEAGGIEAAPVEAGCVAAGFVTAGLVPSVGRWLFVVADAATEFEMPAVTAEEVDAGYFSTGSDGLLHRHGLGCDERAGQYRRGDGRCENVRHVFLPGRPCERRERTFPSPIAHLNSIINRM